MWEPLPLDSAISKLLIAMVKIRRRQGKFPSQITNQLHISGLNLQLSDRNRTLYNYKKPNGPGNNNNNNQLRYLKETQQQLRQSGLILFAIQPNQNPIDQPPSKLSCNQNGKNWVHDTIHWTWYGLGSSSGTLIEGISSFRRRRWTSSIGRDGEISERRFRGSKRSNRRKKKKRSKRRNREGTKTDYEVLL